MVCESSVKSSMKSRMKISDFAHWKRGGFRSRFPQEKGLSTYKQEDPTCRHTDVTQ